MFPFLGVQAHLTPCAHTHARCMRTCVPRVSLIRVLKPYSYAGGQRIYATLPIPWRAIKRGVHIGGAYMRVPVHVYPVCVPMLTPYVHACMVYGCYTHGYAMHVI